MPMPAGVGAVDLMIGFPSANARSHYDYLRAMTKDAGVDDGVPRRLHVQGRPQPLRRGRRPDRGHAAAEMDHVRRRHRLVGARTGDVAKRALKDHPDRFVGQPRDRPQRHHRRGAQDPRRQGRARHQGGHDVSRRLQPAGAGERPPLLPDLPDVHRPRHPDRVVNPRHARRLRRLLCPPCRRRRDNARPR